MLPVKVLSSRRSREYFDPFHVHYIKDRNIEMRSLVSRIR